MAENKAGEKWIYCNSCNKRTKHTLVSEFKREDEEELNNEYIIWWRDCWYLWQCKGCEDVTIEKTSEFSEETDWDGRPSINKELFPKRGTEQHKAKIFRKIPSKLEKIYEEIILNYNESCQILCAIGLRALLEGICVDKDIQGSNLLEKIDKATFVPESIRNNLHGFRFLGNSAAHELVQPKLEDLKVAILVIEDILNIAYELDYKSKLVFDRFNKEKK